MTWIRITKESEMKHISRSSKKVMKRFGVVILSAVMILTGALALSGTVDFGKIAWNDEGDAYAKVAEKTEKSIGDTFPELTKTKSSDKLSKDETVYVIMDADGNKEETLVSEWLKNPEKLDKINDKSNLSDIKNTSGDEEYTKDGSKVVWNAGGNDIKYTGKSDSDLPVSCEVTYYLDGEEVSGEEGSKYFTQANKNYGELIMFSGYTDIMSVFEHVKSDSPAAMCFDDAMDWLDDRIDQ